MTGFILIALSTISGIASGPGGAATAPRERLVAPDIVRGFALFGILVLNIRYFTMPLREFRTFLGLARWNGSGALSLTGSASLCWHGGAHIQSCCLSRRHRDLTREYKAQDLLRSLLAYTQGDPVRARENIHERRACACGQRHGDGLAVGRRALEDGSAPQLRGPVSRSQKLDTSVRWHDEVSLRMPSLVLEAVGLATQACLEEDLIWRKIFEEEVPVRVGAPDLQHSSGEAGAHVTRTQLLPGGILDSHRDSVSWRQHEGLDGVGSRQLVVPEGTWRVALVCDGEIESFGLERADLERAFAIGFGGGVAQSSCAPVDASPDDGPPGCVDDATQEPPGHVRQFKDHLVGRSGRRS